MNQPTKEFQPKLTPTECPQCVNGKIEMAEPHAFDELMSLAERHCRKCGGLFTLCIDEFDPSRVEWVEKGF